MDSPHGKLQRWRAACSVGTADQRRAYQTSEPYAPRRPRRSKLPYALGQSECFTSCTYACSCSNTKRCERGLDGGNRCYYCWNRRAASWLGAASHARGTSLLCRPQHTYHHMGRSETAAVHSHVRSKCYWKQHDPAATSISARTFAQRLGNASYKHGSRVLCRPQHKDNHMGRSPATFLSGPERTAVQA